MYPEQELAKTPTRETEVSKVVKNLHKALECLAQSVEATEVRLAIVTRGVSNNKDVSDKAVEPLYNTELAQTLNGVNDRILSFKDRLDYLLSRIEL